MPLTASARRIFSSSTRPTARRGRRRRLHLPHMPLPPLLNGITHSSYRSPWERYRVQERYTHIADVHERRRLVLNTIDRGGFGWWVVFVAGIGFFTDAYDIFAINLVLPMIGHVYWAGEIPLAFETAMKTATLIGTMFGMVGVGVLADRYGRRKMYGFELMVMVCGTVGVAMCSSGQSGSMSILGWMIFWRLFMGLGIGADYPLSAIITAEFAPTKHRGRMMALLFLMQGLGQLCALVMSVAFIRVFKHRIPTDPAVLKCETDECKKGLDTLWRLIVGLGALPAFVAIFFRLTIPESPRYTLDVDRDFAQAGEDVIDYFGESIGIGDGEVDYMAELMGYSSSMAGGGGGDNANYWREEHGDDGSEYGSVSRISSIAESIAEPANGLNSPGFHSTALSTPGAVITGARSSPNSGAEVGPAPLPATSLPIPFSQQSPRQDSNTILDQLQIREASLDTTGQRRPNTTSSFQPAAQTSTTTTHEESPKPSDHQPPTGPSEHPPTYPYTASWADAKHYFLTLRHWRHLAGTSLTWFVLDFAFFGLGMNTPNIINQIWDAEKRLPGMVSIYAQLFNAGARSLMVVSLGAVFGGLLMFALIDVWGTKKIQLWGFITLSFLFVVVGSVFQPLVYQPYHWVIVALYVTCQVFFNLGPNTTTFILPAEIFPTRYRCTSHGISAASGKLGAGIVQLFLALVRFKGKKVDEYGLGHVLLVFAAFMVLGALLTWFWVPETRDVKAASICTCCTEDHSEAVRAGKEPGAEPGAEFQEGATGSATATAGHRCAKAIRNRHKTRPQLKTLEELCGEDRPLDGGIELSTNDHGRRHHGNRGHHAHDAHDTEERGGEGGLPYQDEVESGRRRGGGGIFAEGSHTGSGYGGRGRRGGVASIGSTLSENRSVESI